MRPPGGSRIAFWPRTTRLSVASYRIRCAQVRVALAADGIATSLWRPATRRPPEAPGILVLSKLSRPEALEAALELRRARGTRLVIDLCDNIFFDSDAPERRAAAARLAAMLGAFDAIVTPSAYLRDAIAARAGAEPRYVVIPDAVEAPPSPALFRRLVEARALRALAARKAELVASGVAAGRRLVWYGIAGTRKARNGLFDLETLLPELEAHHAAAPVALTIVTDDRARFAETVGASPIGARFVAWNRWTVDACLAAHDVAILPARPNAYNFAKSANRLTTAFARGLAVAASAIPSYEPFRDAAVLDDWGQGLGGLMAAPEDRAARVAAAGEIIARDYTLARVTREWRVLFEDFLRDER